MNPTATATATAEAAAGFGSSSNSSRNLLGRVNSVASLSPNVKAAASYPAAAAHADAFDDEYDIFATGCPSAGVTHRTLEYIFFTAGQVVKTFIAPAYVCVKFSDRQAAERLIRCGNISHPMYCKQDFSSRIKHLNPSTCISYSEFCSSVGGLSPIS